MYAQRTVEELRRECARRGLRRYHKLRKVDLVALLDKCDRDGPPPAEPPAASSPLAASSPPPSPPPAKKQKAAATPEKGSPFAALGPKMDEDEDDDDESPFAVGPRAAVPRAAAEPVAARPPPGAGLVGTKVEEEEEEEPAALRRSNGSSSSSSSSSSSYSWSSAAAGSSAAAAPASPGPRATVRSHVVASGVRKPRMSITSEELMPAEALSKLHGASVRSIAVLAEQTLVNPQAERVIDAVLPSPAEWGSFVPGAPGEKFTLLRTRQEFESLLYSARMIVGNEPTVVDLPAPAKIFGDIHGQIGALRDLFINYSSPQHKNGDIRHVNYVFLGDFVDRGPHSLEVITLLMALKVRYPRNVFLVRGNHEDRSINVEYGFLYECLLRLPISWGISRLDAYNMWDMINDMFDLLPLAAVVGERLFCVHGGIGNNLTSVDQLRKLTRPLVLDDPDLPTDVLNLVQDALWSDPSDNDHMLGAHASPRGEGIFSFGPDVVESFRARNDLDIIVRAHQCIEAGVEAFARGHLWTVFSAHHYMARSTYIAVMVSTPGRPAASREDIIDFDDKDLGVQILISKQVEVQSNWGALLEVSADLRITPKIVKESART